MKFTIPLITTLLSLLPILVSGQDDPLACRNCNVDVDDSDPRIVYSPAASWTHHKTDAIKSLYYNNTDSFARVEGAKAMFTFTGMGIEYWALKPTHEVTIQIDGETLSSDTAPNLTTSTIIIASRAFNTSGEHTITMTATDNGTVYLASIGLDRFRIDNGSVTSSTSDSSTTSPSATKSSASCLHSTQAGMAIGGFLMSFLLICAL